MQRRVTEFVAVRRNTSGPWPVLKTLLAPASLA